MEHHYNTVAAVVDSVLTDLGETGTHRFQQFLAFAYAGLREIRLDVTQETRSVQLEMDALKRIDLPPDFVDWTEVALIFNGSFVVVNRSQKNAFTYRWYEGPKHPHAVPQGQLKPGELLNIGVPYRNAFFDLDPGAHTLNFSSLATTGPIALHYISDGLSNECCDNEILNPYLVDYLTCYIHWRRVKGDDRAPQSLKDEKGEDLHYAERKARARLLGMSFSDMLQIHTRPFRRFLY